MKPVKNKNFGSYLAGLIEGDGFFVVPSSIRDSKNRRRYPLIKVAFRIQDKNLAVRLQNYYGGQFEEKKNYFVWKLTQKDLILSLCHDINGYLRTPKFNDFYKLIKFIKKQDPFINFEVLPLNDAPIDSDAWLAGFSDAEGNFNLSVTNRKKNLLRVQLSFRIEVQHFYKKILIENSENLSSFAPICNKIALFFNLGIYHRTRVDKYHSIIIASTSVATNVKVVNYFDKFSLFSSKYLNYCDWKCIHQLQVKKLHLTPEGIKLCKKIKKNFNNNRTKFSWDHLDHFYI